MTRRGLRPVAGPVPAAGGLLTGTAPLAVLSVALLAALVMMGEAMQNSALFGRVYSLLLVVNLLGVVAMVALLAANLRHLVAQYRARAPGSRLTMRLLLLFVLLAGAPVSVVYVFSIQTLQRGIDNWFDVKIDRALDDALLLGRTALDAVKRDLLKSAGEMAAELEILSYSERPGTHRVTLLPALEGLREQHGLGEVTLFAPDGKILASVSETGPEPGAFVPERPRDAVLAQVRQGQPYANIEVVGRAGLRLRVVVPVYSREVGSPLHILQVLQALPPRYTKLGESVQSAYAEYEKLAYLRGPLKFGLTLTLTLVALFALLAAAWAAILTARRVAAPIRELAEGTRAVAAGDYRKQLPVMSHDEIGVLVESFNDMTSRIHRAQSDSRRSQREAERSRAYLETVLTHLSSGVLALDARGRLRTHNAAAGAILAAELGGLARRPLGELARVQPAAAPLVEAIETGRRSEQPEWQSEVEIEIDGARRRLMLRATRLPLFGTRRGGYVVVFDDITALIQAQRHAAWAEVARRMAHEIKNPLTPIQLSAERIRHKFLGLLGAEERATLERATHTIIDQVESLKHMVNAFSSYARPSSIELGPVSMNELVRDVIELYAAAAERPLELARAGAVRLRAADAGEAAARTVTLNLSLDAGLPPLHADAGRLRQVLHNLILNARDALSGTPRPAIRLTTQLVEEGGRRMAELRIADNGPGFPPELMARLFEPYVTSKEKGTGLGLAIVKRIVEEHAGSIRAENLKEGGACITIRLPLAEVPARAGDDGHRRAAVSGNNSRDREALRPTGRARGGRHA
jgi:nitrogen fixation/metabolism regulation signal transduction histidine kinase